MRGGRTIFNSKEIAQRAIRRANEIKAQEIKSQKESVKNFTAPQLCEFEKKEENITIDVIDDVRISVDKIKKYWRKIMYKPYFSRFLNQRKRKLKSAYIAKVITGVIAVISITSSSFVVLADNQDPFDALGILDTGFGIEQQLDTDPDLDNEPNYDIDGESDDMITGGGDDDLADENDDEEEEDLDDEDETDEDALTDEEDDEDEEEEEVAQADIGAADAGSPEYNEAVEAFWNAFADFDTLKTEYANGDISYEELVAAYDNLVEAHFKVLETGGELSIEQQEELDNYRNTLEEYNLAMEGYPELLANFEAAEAATENAVEEYEAALDEYKQTLTDYANKLADYAKALAQFRIAQAAGEDIPAPTAPDKLVIEKPVAPAEYVAAEAPKVPERPELPEFVAFFFAQLGIAL